MQRVTPVRAIAAGGVLALAAAVLRPACGGTAPGAASGAAGEAGGAASSGAGGAGASGGASATGGGGSAGAPVYDGGTWQPTGNAGWTKIPWVDCGATYAKYPEHAVPPLVWKPCEGELPGCERLVVNWEYDFPPMGTQSSSNGGVFKTTNGIVLILAVLMKPGVKIAAAYADAKTPIAAWDGPAGCRPWHFEWSSTHICQAFGGVPPLRVGLLPPDAPNGAAFKSFKSSADMPVACNDTHLFVMDTANQYHVRALETDEVHAIGWTQGIAFKPRVHGNVALVPRRSWDANNNNANILEGWIWTPPNTLAKLVDAAPELVYDIRTDGTTLVWLQCPQSPGLDLDVLPGDVWVSPFSADPAKLQPKKLRSVPGASIGLSNASLGGGYYAVLEPKMLPDGTFPLPDSPDHRLHVYRLSDGRHWEVPRIPDPAPGTKKPESSLAVPVAVLEITADEVWWQGESQYSHQTWTIVRQRLDALGPGD
jgi:hypothetical protein